MPKRNNIQIVQLKRCNSSVTMDRVEMRHIVADYYEPLLSTDIPNADILQMRQKFWTATSAKVAINCPNATCISLHIIVPP